MSLGSGGSPETRNTQLCRDAIRLLTRTCFALHAHDMDKIDAMPGAAVERYDEVTNLDAVRTR